MKYINLKKEVELQEQLDKYQQLYEKVAKDNRNLKKAIYLMAYHLKTFENTGDFYFLEMIYLLSKYAVDSVDVDEKLTLNFIFEGYNIIENLRYNNTKHTLTENHNNLFFDNNNIELSDDEVPF